MKRFDKAYAYVIENEGIRFTCHPDDRGGATKFGITQETFDQWRELQQLGTKSVKDITEQEAKEIYEKMYFRRCRLEEVKEEQVAIVIFDQAVNVGVKEASKRTQRVVNKYVRSTKLNVDGVIGPKTLAALNRVKLANFMPEFFGESLMYYAVIVANNPSQSVFIKGWTRRALKLLELYLGRVKGYK